jgi:hypothetical protein
MRRFEVTVPKNEAAKVGEYLYSQDILFSEIHGQGEAALFIFRLDNARTQKIIDGLDQIGVSREVCISCVCVCVCVCACGGGGGVRLHV